MTQIFEDFKLRIINAREQTKDLVDFGYFDNSMKQPLGMTVGDLWETAKFQFSEAKKLAETLSEEEKEQAFTELKKFREKFSEHMSRLE